MKTKYIKVPVERLPEKSGVYIIDRNSTLMGAWFNGSDFFRNSEIISVEYWLEEVPDREDEMKDLLREIYPLLMERNLYEPGQKIQKILNEIYLTQ